ncbi:putative glycoside hydrolase [Dethiobacter alkaliphilus]|uniref:putative glycoside hydrolase n=1 Tax=Dethiobacter alkaliphilus TaxID=427926 RepID=UPI00222658F2|nr:putative glycoside hydrolase [Dethiobacter alkaliphilus]MCW3491012.1 putative glycoside hydrolase [Dethiobacter alkaliphilus]
MVVLLGLSLFYSGCVEDTFSRVEDPVEQEENTEEPEEEGLTEEEERQLAEEARAEERRQREEALKKELGHFFVPLPAEEPKDNPHVQAKGIYVTGNTAGGTGRFAELLDLLDNTELNTMVIDVKNDHGLMTYNSEIEIVKEVGANRATPIRDISALMETLNEHDVYPIARVVVFRDPHLPEKQPDWAIQKKDGSGVWRDRSGYAWVNPYDKNVWDYNIAIAKEAALHGFREIQFDYVRFPENARRVDEEANFPGSEGKERDKAIEAFLAYAREELSEYNVHISADVFGVISTSWGDSDRIGQSWERIAPLTEIISPMIYPSHYGPGYFGFAVPDANPGGTVTRALEDALKRNAPLENPGVIRPWLQSFTATWVRGHIRYGAEQVREQIDAALELGIDEYLIWNAANRYHKDAFLPADKAAQREEAKKSERREAGHDQLGRTAEEALKDYLEAMRRTRWREAYAWQSTTNTMDHAEFREWLDSHTSSLEDYEITNQSSAGDNVEFTLSAELKFSEGNLSLENSKFQVLQVNGVWRVRPDNEFLEILTKDNGIND